MITQVSNVHFCDSCSVESIVLVTEGDGIWSGGHAVEIEMTNDDHIPCDSISGKLGSTQHKSMVIHARITFQSRRPRARHTQEPSKAFEMLYILVQVADSMGMHFGKTSVSCIFKICVFTEYGVGQK